MQLTDVPISPSTFKMELIANNTESSKEMTKQMDEYLIGSFIDFLEDQNLVSRSALNKTLGTWIDSVSYHEFSRLFDAFWKQWIDEIPRGRILEIVAGIGIQIVSVFQRMKPPERSVFREIAKTRTALKLLDLLAQV